METSRNAGHDAEFDEATQIKAVKNLSQ